MSNGIEEKKSVIGSGLLTARDEALRAAETLKQLWEGGECRLTDEFLKKIFEKTGDIKNSVEEVRKWIMKFDTIKMEKSGEDGVFMVPGMAGSHRFDPKNCACPTCHADLPEKEDGPEIHPGTGLQPIH